MILMIAVHKKLMNLMEILQQEFFFSCRTAGIQKENFYKTLNTDFVQTRVS